MDSAMAPPPPEPAEGECHYYPLSARFLAIFTGY